ncbi:hypothetical protein AMR41_19590 [Hapalosiphon sp. MRB220]|nr:hypothetical protein AMR41_19590 [Hapalosiphon sp. MRB220]
MVHSTQISQTSTESISANERLVNKSSKVIKNIFRDNINSNYTEIIQELDKNFDYTSNSNCYWSEPEQSLLYGTPLYQAASSSQKLALNHLYWAMQYSKVPLDEAGTMMFNQVTASVFSTLGGFETLCQELDLETTQESYHIHAFQRISRLTKKALIGKRLTQLSKKTNNDWSKKILKVGQQINLSTINPRTANLFSSLPYLFLRYTNKIMLESKGNQPSKYLQELEKKNEFLNVPTDGVVSQLPFRRLTMQLLTLNCGTSPFLACHYYALRLIANMMLKNWEYNYVLYFRKLKNNNTEFLPAPTAVSYFHFLDESFHTTISKTIAQELYKFFPKPTAYERFVANISIYLMQLNLKSVSSVIPYRFIKDDFSLMFFFYQLLQTSLFDMSATEALYWLEKCFCQEHEGFNITLNSHQHLLINLRQLFGCIEYLWPINYEMRLMNSVNNTNKVIQSNIQTFKLFAKFVTHQ